MEKQQDNDYPKHGVCQQIQKQETEKSNIMNRKTKLTNNRLELIQKLDPFLDYTITSVKRT